MNNTYLENSAKGISDIVDSLIEEIERLEGLLDNATDTIDERDREITELKEKVLDLEYEIEQSKE